MFVPLNIGEMYPEWMSTRRIWIRFPQAEVENWSSLSCGVTIQLNTEKEASLRTHTHFSHLRNVRAGISSDYPCARNLPACFAQSLQSECAQNGRMETHLWDFRALGKSCTAGVRQHCSLGFEELSFQSRCFRKWHLHIYVHLECLSPPVLMN